MLIHRHLLGLFALALAFGCEPEDRCSGELYYDGSSCLPCPPDSKFEDGKCVAEPSKEEDAGAAPEGCAEYCEFTRACIADNPVAAALPEFVAALHADDLPACTSACRDTTGGDGSEDEVVRCVLDGREAAACVNVETQDALGQAITLLGTCCVERTDAPLCQTICAALTSNAILASMVEFCP